MRQFFTIFTGQFASILGTGLTTFALGVYVYQRTGSTTDFAMILFFAYLPKIFLSPLAGPLVDRFNRRTVMIVTDSFAALGTLLLLYLIRAGNIEVWHIYLVTAIGASASAFQLPAYYSAISQLVPKAQLVRANGLVRTADGLQNMLSPMLAAWLLGAIQLKGIIWVDLITFLIAVATLLAVPVPDLPQYPGPKPSMWADLVEGLAYLRQRKPLLGLLILLFGYNFFIGTLMALYTPLILSYADEKALGLFLSLFGGSVVVSGMVLTAIGGPKRLMHGILIAMMTSALPMIMAGTAQGWLAQASACILFGAGMPVAMSCNMAIWQKKIPHRLQGRIHSTRMMVAFASTPLAYLLCGPLVDDVFEPLMTSGGTLATLLQPIFGSGPGRSIGVLLALMGTLNLVFVICATLVSRLRRLEDHIPDAIGE